jgi:tRNA pseudouridine55 synthase
MVALTRKAFRTRAVGHAGTLDPMATGLLVLAMGEATKLVPYLAGEDKEYAATIALGRTTDSLDADGRVTEELPVPASLDAAEVVRVARGFPGVIEQKPPAVSAIKSGGLPLHRRVRRGETVDPDARRVELHELRILDVRRDAIDIHLRCGKGFYVRALARDLARALGTVGHLSALRRLRSGGFAIEDAVNADHLLAAAAAGGERSRLLTRLLPLAACCGAMPRLVLDDEGQQDAFHGRPIPMSRVLSGLPSPPPPPETRVALLDADSRLVAIARTEHEAFLVERGFRYPP